MKRTTFLLIAGCLTLAVSGCGNNERHKAILDTLKDPDSAKFGKEAVFQWRACGVVNAKNSYGGYTGDETYWLKSSNRSIGGDQNWSVTHEDALLECKDSVLVKLVERDKRVEEFDRRIIQVLNSKNLYKVDGEALPYASPNEAGVNKCLQLANKASRAFNDIQTSIVVWGEDTEFSQMVANMKKATQSSPKTFAVFDNVSNEREANSKVATNALAKLDAGRCD
jgi:hypothetical protein